MQHGVVVAAGRRVLAVAVNTERNHPRVCSDPKREAAYHAEHNALRQVAGMGVDPRRLTVYSARVNKAGQPVLAKPCSACADLLEAFGIRDVVWT